MSLNKLSMFFMFWSNRVFQPFSTIMKAFFFLSLILATISAMCQVSLPLVSARPGVSMNSTSNVFEPLQRSRLAFVSDCSLELTLNSFYNPHRVFRDELFPCSRGSNHNHIFQWFLLRRIKFLRKFKNLLTNTNSLLIILFIFLIMINKNFVQFFISILKITKYIL